MSKRQIPIAAAIAVAMAALDGKGAAEVAANNYGPPPPHRLRTGRPRQRYRGRIHREGGYFTGGSPWIEMSAAASTTMARAALPCPSDLRSPPSRLWGGTRRN